MGFRQLDAYAQVHFSEGFANALYIGRHQIWPDGERRPHKFYYIGYRDMFGVLMPSRGKAYAPQIWGTGWVRGRSERLDQAVKDAMKGKFPEVRHNLRIQKRAKTHGKTFIKPTWRDREKALALKEATEKLPIRGRKKRRRRKLLV